MLSWVYCSLVRLINQVMVRSEARSRSRYVDVLFGFVESQSFPLSRLIRRSARWHLKAPSLSLALLKYSYPKMLAWFLSQLRPNALSVLSGLEPCAELMNHRLPFQR